MPMLAAYCNSVRGTDRCAWSLKYRHVAPTNAPALCITSLPRDERARLILLRARRGAARSTEPDTKRSYFMRFELTLAQTRSGAHWEVSDWSESASTVDVRKTTDSEYRPSASDFASATRAASDEEESDYDDDDVGAGAASGGGAAGDEVEDYDSDEFVVDEKRARKASKRKKGAASSGAPKGRKTVGSGRSFFPARSFGGRKAGYEFKVGDTGLGYYLTAANQQQQELAEAAASAARLPDVLQEYKVVHAKGATLRLGFEADSPVVGKVTTAPPHPAPAAATARPTEPQQAQTRCVATWNSVCECMPRGAGRCFRVRPCSTCATR